MSNSSSAPALERRRRLAIIGGGSSGLISLKAARDALVTWDITCFEASDRITGCWGNPYPGFVSTSTKFTTQFACFPKFSAEVTPEAIRRKADFFREDEYGNYLADFADHFQLREHIRLLTRVDQIRPIPERRGWQLTLVDKRDEATRTWTEDFDQIIVCTGLAAEPKRMESAIEQLLPQQLHSRMPIRQRRIVVMGGGESAVDLADRLSRPEHENEVYLSLRSGIRVSPRYHPIRGVPSDFLRNRLMLSIHEDLRNRIGQWFVEARIRHQSVFERLFPQRTGCSKNQQLTDKELERRTQWDHKLTRHAKDNLFNIFHNKSDDFLDAVGQERIQIIGPPADETCHTFHEFDGDRCVPVEPDLLVPSIGYRAQLSELSRGELALSDFFLGCCHVKHPDVHLVGFARPIIGNIPTISEMQARYVCRLIAGELERSASIVADHARDLDWRRRRFPAFDAADVYPVEMFPYCDRLAKLMGESLDQYRWRRFPTWCRQQLEPATTLHYVSPDCLPDQVRRPPIYLPALLIAVLVALKPLDWLYRLWIRRPGQSQVLSGRS